MKARFGCVYFSLTYVQYQAYLSCQKKKKFKILKFDTVDGFVLTTRP